MNANEQAGKGAAGHGNPSPRALRKQAESLIAENRATDALALLQPFWEQDRAALKLPLVMTMVRAGLSAGRPDWVRPIVDFGRQTWPDHAGLQLAEARLLLAEERPDEALARLQQLAEGEEADRAVLVQLANALAAAGRHDEALATLERVEARFGATAGLARRREAVLVAAGRKEGEPDESADRRKAIRQHIAAGDHQAALAAIRQFLDDGLEYNRAEAVSVGELCLEQGEAGLAHRTVIAARRRWPAHPQLNLLAVIAAVASEQPVDPAARQALALDKEALGGIRQQIMRLVNAGQRDHARQLVALLSDGQAFSAPGDAAALLRMFILVPGIDRHDVGNVFDRVAGQGGLTANQALTFAELLFEYGDHDRARRAFELAVGAAAKPGQQARARLQQAQFLAAIDAVPAARATLDEMLGSDGADGAGLRRATWLRASLGGPAPERDDPVLRPDEWLLDGAAAHYRRGEGRCVIFFGPVNTLTMVDQLDCLLPPLAARGVSLIAVNDAHRRAGISGAGPHFPDRAATAAALRALAEERGYGQLATAGASLSASAAILTGLEIKAAGAFSLSGFSHFPAVEHIVEPAFAATYRRLVRTAPDDLVDLVPALSGRDGFILHHHYGARSRLDGEQVAHIEGLAGVQVTRVAGAQHAPLLKPEDQPALTQALDRFIDALGW